ncbi:unnamed protein product [Paramecium sonneborni]|uniref:Uncharacterized protein n=1 Tax=Paramecium sonneborni TaxID=65129 RepID=A0A8S1JYZ2_9CILI|nr:unnamed protein product [Paramecium sonneborni]
MKIIVLIFLLGAFASNIRHKRERNTDSQTLSHQQQNKKELLQVSDIDNESQPFVEETLNQEQNLEEPKPLYNNDGRSPDMGLNEVENNDAPEAPMMADNVLDYSAQEEVITGVSLIQVGEIDALANIDTSMPLLDEDFKYDEQALQETPLNIDIIEEVPQSQDQDINQIDDQLQQDIQIEDQQDQQDQLINEVQLLQIGGFYY